jgi:SAM-dependent methyltransferase
METMSRTSEYPGLRNQPDQGRIRGPVLQALRRFLRTQFGRPEGFWGSLAGRIMAATPSNNDRIRWTLGLLDIKPADRILEVGFGPGIAIALASERASNGFVAGLDHSVVMVRQASKRNARAVREGRVALRLGSAADPPVFDQPFDKIFTINSIHFWAEPLDCLTRLQEQLRPGGTLAVTLQPRSRDATDETTKVIGRELVANLERIGLSRCRLEIKRAHPVSIACALGTKVGGDS